MMKGYFEFLIGAVTMDAYQPIEGGVVYILDCTHGFDSQSIHIASRFPRPLLSNDILATFPLNVWLAIGISIFLIIVMVLCSMLVYMQTEPSKVRLDLDVLYIIIRLVAGFTEPDDGSWFKTFSTGRFIMLGYYVFSFFCVALFLQDLRSLLILPRMEDPINFVSQVDFGTTKVALGLPEGIMLTITSTQLFTTVHPKYSQFKSTMIENIKSEMSAEFNNVHGLRSHEILYDLAEKDVNPDGALIIMQKRTYLNYVIWLSKNHPNEYTNLRLSPYKLDTKFNTEKYILLHAKFNPYAEELNRFILLIEVSFMASLIPS